MQRRDLLKRLAVGVSAITAGTLTPAQPTEAAEPLPRVGKPLEHSGVLYWAETSLRRVFPNSPAGSAEPLLAITCRNAQLSLQACVRNLKDASIRVRATVQAPDGWSVRVRRVGYVPMTQQDTDVPAEEMDGVGHVPGFVPDPLYPEPVSQIGPASNGAFWITVRIPSAARVGVTRLKVTLQVEDEFHFPAWSGKPLPSVELAYDIDVRPLVLAPRRDFPATQWISLDSIWEYYKLEPFNERFWELADKYVANMIEHQLNVIYSPIFNARHELLERPAQLLKVRRAGEHQYEFDFSDVRRWIRLAVKHGAAHLEWTHLFTPAPTSGKHPQRIYERWDKFGKLLWPPETLAVSDDYRKFLAQFLPEFKKVLAEEQVLEKSLFHCADEPDGDEQLADYRRARNMLRELAPWMKVIDAMSDTRFAKAGLTDMPVPSIAVADQFTAAGVPAWVYFCCGPRGPFLQRLLTTPLAKWRMAGWLFYKLNARGFLHWGHNYWFVFCTGTPTNPFTDAAVSAWPGMPHGDAFVVYPGKDGPIDSIRWEVFAESMQDYAMLQLAEVARDDQVLSDLKTYAVFPKNEGWLQSALAEILSRKLPEHQP